jgi:LPXTG-motif cell wall-anchored protein
MRSRLILAAAFLAALPAMAATNGPGVPGAEITTGDRPPVESLVVGAIQGLAVNQCVLTYSLQVTADAGGGTDTFRLDVWDDGLLVRSVPLSVPADGAVHAVSGTVAVPPINQTTPGLGVYLVDAAILDAEDPFASTCVAFEIPTAQTVGLAGLGALVGLAAVVVLRRRRKSD